MYFTGAGELGIGWGPHGKPSGVKIVKIALLQHDMLQK
jgi:hypothetical protein